MPVFGSSDKKTASNITGSVNLGDVNGDLIQIYNDRPLPPELSLPWRTATEDSDIFALLEWRTRLSDLVGRDEELNELLTWARTGAGISARFLTGPGGAGKSRLAAETAQILANEGWSAGFVPLEGNASYPYAEKGAFLIIDYPEENREAVTTVLKILGRTPSTDEHSLRILLVSREGRDLWQSHIQDAHASGAFNAGQIAIENVQSANDAYTVYCTVQQNTPNFDAANVQEVSETALADWLQQTPVNHRPLYIVAAAVHSVIVPKTSVVTLTGPKVVQALADREASRLRNEGKSHGLGDHGLERLTALAAISNGLSEDDIRRLAARDLQIGLPDPNEVIDKVNATGRTANGILPAPVPDIVAAAFLTAVLAERPKMAPEWIWAALEPDVTAGLNRLGRLTFDAEVELGLRHFHYGEALASMVQDDAERSRACEASVVDEQLPIVLVPLHVAVWRTLLTHAEDDVERARYLNNLSLTLRAAGDTKGALEAGGEAVPIYRRLAAAHPERFNLGLAQSLNTLSNCLGDTGDTKGALVAIRESVTIRRGLVAASPIRFNPDLAEGLNNLSGRLSDAGDNEGALEAIQDAVPIYRRLAAAQPERFNPGLATSLSTLSSSLSDAGDTDGALEAIREGVAIRRSLAAAQPERFNADLSTSLNNLSIRLSNAGDTEGALDAIQDAVTIYRRLAAAQPERFNPDLAMGLNNLSNRLDETGDPEGALQAIREAVEISRGLAVAQPERYNPYLAGSLGNLSNRLSNKGDTKGALGAMEEAVSLIEPFAQRYPNSENGKWRDSMRADLARLQADAEN